MVRLLIVITRLAVGGAPRMVLDGAAGLRRRGYEITIATGIPGPGEGSLLGEAEETGLDVRVIPDLVREVSPVRDARAMAALFRLVREGRFDIVHTHLSKAGVLGRLAARAAGARAVAHTYHGDVFDGYFGKAESAVLLSAERIAARCCDGLLAVSRPLAARLRARRIGRSGRTRIVRNGVPLDRFTPRCRDLGPAPVRVGAVAMFYRVKRLDLYIAAARRVQRTHPGVRFFLAGGGQEDARLRALASDLGEGFTFLGIRNDVAEVLKDFDVFVATSDYEGAGIGLMEAMCAGVPVVATRSGGVAEIVRDGRDGLLVDPGDAEAIAGAILRLIEDPGLRARLGREAAKRARADFGVERAVDRLDGVYKDLLRGPRS